MTRSEFFRKGGRWGLFAVMGIVTAYLLLQNRIVVDRNSCDPQLCGQCRDLKQCRKPEAQNAQHDKKG